MKYYGQAKSGRTSGRTITDSDIRRFGGLTGDFSELHFNKQLAGPEGNNIAHGLLAANFALGALSLEQPWLLGNEDPSAAIQQFAVNFRAPVHAEDTLSTEWAWSAEGAVQKTDFTVRNQHNAAVSDGSFNCHSSGPKLVQAVWPASRTDSFERQTSKSVWYLEDYIDNPLSGVTASRTLSEADIANFAALMGDYSPHSTDVEFARQGNNGKVCVQPLLVFSIGFAAWLREWMMLPMPGAGFAGHLRDEWQSYQAAFIGDTIHCRYQTLDVRHSNSKPDMGIITFGLQIVNQDGQVLQQASVLMMYPARPAD